MATVFTVGHSVHEPDEFLEILHAQDVGLLVDVRRHPASRRVPHFNSGVLAQTLSSAGIDYRHAEDLGGRREPAADSPNGGWTNPQFRGYADHMSTTDFVAALYELESDMRERPTVVMCAEADWRRCHRRLLADVLVAREHQVMHLGADGPEPHEQTPFAVIANKTVTYPPVQGSLEV